MSSSLLIPDPTNTPKDHELPGYELSSTAPGTGLFGIIEVVTAAHAKPIFTDVLKVCFAPHFNLLRTPLLDKPFIGTADVIIEPVEFRDFCRIFMAQALGAEKIMGMTLDEATHTTSMKHDIWWTERNAHKNTGRSVGLLDILHGENRKTMTTAITIDDTALDTMREMRSWKIRCPAAGTVREAPLTLETTLEHLNTLIRADTNNKMGLRIVMRLINIKAIRDAGAGGDGLPAMIVRDKMEREALSGPRGFRD
ncbi:hypothetical protein DFH09DRAFT_1310065 [Mycena vulgaris]|nr:hypothetical protein DFH09DRAFT_1310065 [Mycena vulgaris]